VGQIGGSDNFVSFFRGIFTLGPLAQAKTGVIGGKASRQLETGDFLSRKITK
jgi:hypothetical protein